MKMMHVETAPSSVLSLFSFHREENICFKSLNFLWFQLLQFLLSCLTCLSRDCL